MPLQDYLHLPAVLGLLSLIAFTALTAEWLVRCRRIPDWAGRKLLHVVAVSAVAFSHYFIYKPWLVYSIYTFFILALMLVISFGNLRVQQAYHRKSWGIAWFPVAFLILYGVFHQATPQLITLSMVVLALADAAAAIAGHLASGSLWNLHQEPKTFAGSIAFFITTLFVVLLFPAVSGLGMLIGLKAMLTLVTVVTLFEALSSRGSDNLWVPLSFGFLLHFMQAAGNAYHWEAFGFAVAFYGCVRMGWLSKSGAVAGWLMAMHLYVAVGWKAIIPPALFFVAGSLLSKLPRNVAIMEEKAGKPRDAWQVAANGLVAAICLVLYAVYGHSAFLVGFGASIACSLADTSASEVGLWIGGRPTDILSGKKVEVGKSGGITTAGVFGAAAGSLLIALIMAFLFALPWPYAAIIAVAGVAGMLLDSMMGSRLQARFVNEKGEVFEHRVENSTLQGGVRWMDNDAVNMLSCLITAVLAMAAAAFSAA